MVDTLLADIHLPAPRLDSLKEVHRARQAELRRMEGDTESAKNSLEKLEESSSERQLKFYRTMTLYVHNLVECLQEKVCAFKCSGHIVTK